MKKRANGEGSLYYSNSLKRWVIQYIEPLTHKKKKIVQKKNEPVTEFKKKYFKIISQINDDEYISGSKATISSIAEEINTSLRKANKIKENSYTRRQETLKKIQKLSIADIPIQKVTAKQINEDLTNLTNYANSSIDKVYSMISSTFRYAVSYNIVKTNPFAEKMIIKPKSIKEDKKVEALTVEQQKSFEEELKKTNDYYKDVFYILLYSGARVGEVLALTGKDIDLTNKVIHIRRTLTKDVHGKAIMGKTTKTYSGIRDVPIIDKLLPHIPVKSPNELLFKKDNKLIRDSTINSHFKKLCKNAGINVVVNANKSKIYKGTKIKVNLKTSTVNTHMLRHTFATRCIEAGMSAVALSKILGHKDVQTTLNIYISVFRKFQKEELDKVEKYLNNL